MRTAREGDIVGVHYTGTLDDGTVFERSEGSGPLRFAIGARDVPSCLQRAVIGMRLGERRTVRIPAAQAFGARSADLVMRLPRERLPQGLDPRVGQEWVGQLPDGRRVDVAVTAVRPDSVTVDLNHPLAGEDLILDIALVELR